jgi:hypothetical protein
MGVSGAFFLCYWHLPLCHISNDYIIVVVTPWFRSLLTFICSLSHNHLLTSDVMDHSVNECVIDLIIHWSNNWYCFNGCSIDSIGERPTPSVAICLSQSVARIEE